jgi:hypothetical protein
MLTRIDRERVARLTAKIEDCYRNAEAATTPQARDRWLRVARSFERHRRYARTFPLGIWLIVVSVVAPMIPWAVLTRVGLGLLGIAAAGVVVLAEFWLWRRYRKIHPPGS